MRSRYINTQQPGRLRWSPVEALRRAWHSITGTRRQQTRVDPAAPWGAWARGWRAPALPERRDGK